MYGRVRRSRIFCAGLVSLLGAIPVGGGPNRGVMRFPIVRQVRRKVLDKSYRERYIGLT
jgi:hypothetical protein